MVCCGPVRSGLVGAVAVCGCCTPLQVGPSNYHLQLEIYDKPRGPGAPPQPQRAPRPNRGLSVLQRPYSRPLTHLLRDRLSAARRAHRDERPDARSTAGVTPKGYPQRCPLCTTCASARADEIRPTCLPAQQHHCRSCRSGSVNSDGAGPFESPADAAHGYRSGAYISLLGVRMVGANVHTAPDLRQRSGPFRLWWRTVLRIAGDDQDDAFE